MARKKTFEVPLDQVPRLQFPNVSIRSGKPTHRRVTARVPLPMTGAGAVGNAAGVASAAVLGVGAVGYRYVEVQVPMHPSERWRPLVRLLVAFVVFSLGTLIGLGAVIEGIDPELRASWLAMGIAILAATWGATALLLVGLKGWSLRATSQGTLVVKGHPKFMAAWSERAAARPAFAATPPPPPIVGGTPGAAASGAPAPTAGGSWPPRPAPPGAGPTPGSGAGWPPRPATTSDPAAGAPWPPRPGGPSI